MDPADRLKFGLSFTRLTFPEFLYNAQCVAKGDCLSMCDACQPPIPTECLAESFPNWTVLDQPESGVSGMLFSNFFGR